MVAASVSDSMSTAQEQDVVIRSATPADVESISSLLSMSFREYEHLYTSEAFATTVATPNQIEDRMHQGPIWVALKNDVIVGSVSAVLKNKEVYIRGMAVNPSERGNGIGRRLLDRAEAFAVSNRCKRLFLSTTPFLSRAINLYEFYGFRRNLEGPDNLFGTPLFTMVKTLKALQLRKTEDRDLDYVLAVEHSDENRSFVIPWSREQHRQALVDPDIVHVIVETQIRVGYVILAGLVGPNQSVELRRIVISEKGKGYGRAAVEMVKDLVFETYQAHRLWLDVKAQNQRARGIYHSAGFIIEGMLRECLRTEDGFDSLVVMSMLRKEYGELKLQA